MTAIAPPRYVLWRCADQKQRPGVLSGSRQPWQSGECSQCGERVWLNTEHVEDRVLVCWPCAREAE